MTAELVTVHHEGAGTPTDVPRGAAGGYTYWIGASRYTRLRSVSESYATLHYNHVSLDICLSGDRSHTPVSDADVALIRAAYADAFARGEVTHNPTVRAHRNSPGSSTVCPGDAAMLRWNDIVLACRAPGPLPPQGAGYVNFAYPSTTKPPNVFRGALVDLDAKHVTLSNAAECNPSPAVIPTNVAWLGCYGGRGAFTVFLANLAEYHFTLP